MQFRPLVTRVRTAGLVLAACIVAGLISVPGGRVVAAPTMSTAKAAAIKAPPIRHVFIVNLENKGYDETFGPDSPAPYLSKTLRARGQLLTQYFGTTHNSLPNNVAQISGQGPDSQTQADCQTYSDFVQTGTVAPQQAVGNGCVYPVGVKTVADHFGSGTWRTWTSGTSTGTECPPVAGAAGLADVA